jgi:hypothetical protein
MTHDEPQMLLLVEDNPADARMISTALRSADSQQFTLVPTSRLNLPGLGPQRPLQDQEVDRLDVEEQ